MLFWCKSYGDDGGAVCVYQRGQLVNYTAGKGRRRFCYIRRPDIYLCSAALLSFQNRSCSSLGYYHTPLDKGKYEQQQQLPTATEEDKIKRNFLFCFCFLSCSAMTSMDFIHAFSLYKKLEKQGGHHLGQQKTHTPRYIGAVTRTLDRLGNGSST